MSSSLSHNTSSAPGEALADSPLDIVVATTNLQRGTSVENWRANLLALSHVDIIVAAEPGDLSKVTQGSDAASDVLRATLSDFTVFYTPRRSTATTGAYGGVAVLARKERFASATSVALTPCNYDVQFCACYLDTGTRTVKILGVYATCAGDRASPSDTRRCVELAARELSAFGDTDAPVVCAGDFNARHEHFGDTLTTPHGRQLYAFAMDRGLRVEAAPSREHSCLDLLLVPAHLRSTEAVTRNLLGTDHRAVLVEIDPDESTRRGAYYTRRLDLTRLRDDDFVRHLDRLLHGTVGTPHGRQRRIATAVTAALHLAGASWKRARIPDHPPPPTVEQLLAAARSNPWHAVALARAAPKRLAADFDLSALVDAFGPNGKQRTHDGPHPQPVPARRVEPIHPAEIRSAIEACNPRACADDDGIDARVMLLAARSTHFCLRLAELITCCMRRGRCPSHWTSCTIRPIPKPNKDATVIANLRPIYLSSMLAKVADRVVDRRIRHVWSPHPNQYGFRKGVPIDIVPLALINDAMKAVSRESVPNRSGNSQPTYALILAVDISDAFPGTATRCIMDGYGQLPPGEKAFKNAMLCGRRIRVSYRGKLSEFEDVVDGTNQGFVSGPTDFSAASSTLLSRLDSEWRGRRHAGGATRNYGMVADDLSAVITGTMTNIRPAAEAFLKEVGLWAAEYGFNISSKSEGLLISPKEAHTPTAPDTWDLRCAGVSVPIRTTGSIRVLGYHLDAKLTFTIAITKAIDAHAKSLFTLLPVIRTFSPMDRKLVYEAIAMPHFRRLAPLLLRRYSDDDKKWQPINGALATAARLMFGMSSTANTASCIVEAGLLDAKSLAIKETIFLRERMRAANYGGSMASPALELLDAYRSGFSEKVSGCGVIVDRQPVHPSDYRFETNVRCFPEPTVSARERTKLRNKRTPREERDRIKRKANQAVRKRIPAGEKCVFCDGSVLKPAIGRRRPSAGGAAVQMLSGRVVASVERYAGRDACSFSAEAVGMDAAVDLINALGPRADEKVHIVTDSQSLVAAIGKGIARQADARIADIWMKLVALVKRTGCHVAIHFAFGHSDWAEADAADHHAKAAALRIPAADEAEKVEWWVDKARAEAKGPIQVQLRSALSGSLREKVIDKGPGWLPTRWRKSEWDGHPQARAAASILAKLRTNACSGIGGHLVGKSTCRLCGATTSRGGSQHPSMVEHMFVCRATTGLRRLHRIRGLKDLWNRPERALRLASKYMLPAA